MRSHFLIVIESISIYGAELTQEGNKTYISGVSWNESLNQGEKTDIVLIVDEGNRGNFDPIKPQFLFADSVSNSVANSPNKSSSTLDIDGEITEDWNGGYKLEVDLTAKSDANNWKLDFNLPYTIREVYGVDLINNGNGSYSINGQNDQKKSATGTIS